jgi:hypothetical protein
LHDRADMAAAISSSFLAQTYGKVGQGEEGLTVLDEARAAVDRSGERFWEAERYRLKGELTLQQFRVPGSKLQVTNLHTAAGAEACFQKAIAIARRQSAKALELRAGDELRSTLAATGQKR